MYLWWSLDVPLVEFGCTSGGVWMYLWWSLDVPLVEFGCTSGGVWMYLWWSLDVPLVEFGCTSGGVWMYLWWSLCTLYLQACQVRVTIGDSGLCKGGPLVEFIYLVFTNMPDESYRRRLKSLLLHLCYVF